MPQKPMELDPGANALAFFGAELRHYRTMRKLSQDRLGELVHYSGALVGQIEKGASRPSQVLAGACDEALGMGGVLSRLWPLVSRESYPAWFQPFVELERRATYLREFMPLSVSGLFQTEEYARAVLRTTRPDYGDDEVEELVESRLERQAILDPPTRRWWSPSWTRACSAVRWAGRRLCWTSSTPC